MKIEYRDEPQHYNPSNLDDFLTIPPLAEDAMARSKAQLAGRPYPREKLADILLEYNKQIGNDKIALDNIAALRKADSICVITGQQVGLMGGPIYTILKAITCLKLAKETGAIPIFWAATEDHDIGEIDHTYLQDSKGNLSRFHVRFRKDAHFVEDLVLNKHHMEVIRAFCEEAGIDKTLLLQFQEGQLYAESMVRLLAALFAGTGLVFVEPKLLRPLAVSFFRKEIQDSDSLFQTIQTTTQRLEAAGGEAILKVEEPTNLFFKTEQGQRRKVKKSGDDFLIGEAFYTKEQLLQLCEKEPSRFSCHAAARPVLQSQLFPTLAYVAGPTELKYYRQLKEYHEPHGVSMPWIVPRISATFIPEEAAKMLGELGLKPWDPIPEKGSGAHLLRNLLHPHNESQERLLNWLGFQAETKENLIFELLKQIDWRKQGHYYWYIGI